VSGPALPRVEGLESLDEERASSMGAEGGRSGQTVDADLPRPEHSTGRRRSWLALSLGIVALVLAWRARVRRAGPA
jgi:hypothetical protein